MSSVDPRAESRAFRMRCWKIDFGSWIAAFVVIAGYLAVVFALPVAESIALVSCLFGWAILVGLASEGGRRLQNAPIIRFLDQASKRDETPESDQADATFAYRAIASLPFQMRKARLFGGLACVFVVPPMMWIFGFEAWMTFERFRSFAIIALVVSLLGGLMCFFWARQGFSSWRTKIAESIGASDDRAALGAKYSLKQNLLIAVTFPALASILLIVDVVSVNLCDIREERAAEWATLVVQKVSESAAEVELAERIENQLPSEEFWPMPIEIVEIRPDRVETTPALKTFSREFLDRLDRQLQSGLTSGPVLLPTGLATGAFRKLDDGTTLVARVRRSDFDSGRNGLDWVIGLVTLCMLVVGIAVARLAGTDFTRGVANLRAAAARIAAGDLSPARLFESEGVLAEVADEINLVREGFHSVVLRMSDTARSVDQITSELSQVVMDVASSSVDQAQHVQQASQLMGTIGTRIGRTNLSVTELTSSIDDANSSVIELGAAGDELNETALVLSSKVDAVSGSLEQMVRSVQQVAGTSDKLAAASEETSSSMEQMASSMRAVDTSAETTANLSSDVVRIAEIGQAKVVQTIAGMEAIREATDAAESVIRGLGARTKEIGGILDVIDDVADETGLLALNAAIIAAQAGDQGKAFSVVADEIKELADRVLASTKEIGSLIRAVQDESENAIGAIEAGSASVMSGVDLSAEAGRTLEEITVASRESGSRITEIVASVREQTKAASHVVSLMERVRESAEEIGTAGNEQSRGNEIVYESALTMREVAQQVRRTTEDQARGFGRIRENVDGMRSAAEQITDSLDEQSGTCNQVTELLHGFSQGTRTNEESAGKIRVAMDELLAHSETLREESERFRV